jgi:hypothetical protein
MHRILVLTLSILFSCAVTADTDIDNKHVKRAVLDYLYPLPFKVQDFSGN